MVVHHHATRQFINFFLLSFILDSSLSIIKDIIVKDDAKKLKKWFMCQEELTNHKSNFITFNATSRVIFAVGFCLDINAFLVK